MDLQQLKDEARKLINIHCEKLHKERQGERRFKRVDAYGRLTGKPFKYDGPTYKQLRRDNIEIRELQSNEKTGDDRKYLYALDAVFNLNCNGCSKTCCPYCKFKINSYGINKLIAISYTDKWQVFKDENNFAPTKQVISLIQPLIEEYTSCDSDYSTCYDTDDVNSDDETPIDGYDFNETCINVPIYNDSFNENMCMPIPMPNESENEINIVLDENIFIDNVLEDITFNYKYEKALIPDEKYGATNSENYYPSHSEMYEENINKHGCNTMISDTIKTIKNIKSKIFVYTDDVSLNTTKHILEYDFQGFHISQNTPTIAKKIRSNIKSLNTTSQINCETEQLLTRIHKNLYIDDEDYIIYADIYDYCDIRSIITLYMNAQKCTRLYMCYPVPNMKKPDHHIIYSIREYLIEYNNRIRLVKFPRYPDFFTAYKMNNDDYVFSYKSKKNWLMFYAIDII